MVFCVLVKQVGAAVTTIMVHTVWFDQGAVASGNVVLHAMSDTAHECSTLCRQLCQQLGCAGLQYKQVHVVALWVLPP
jgi:hypothetical protein